MKLFKMFIAMAIISLIAASPALAVEDIQTAPVFSVLSSALSGTTTGTYVDTGLRTKKTVIVSGKKGTAFGNYSGTFKGECGATSSGPWVTAKDKHGTAVSATTNTVFNLDDLCRYFRPVYTRNAARGTKGLSAWILYGQ